MIFIPALALAAATGYADLDAVDRAVAMFVESEGSSGATPVDRRLRLQPCTAPLALSWRTQARASVVVQCGDPGGWRLYVPMKQALAASGSPVVSRGDAVSISVTGEGFTVSQPGEAMDSGAVGAWVRVRPVAARAGADPMRAQVVRPGLVALPLP